MVVFPVWDVALPGLPLPARPAPPDGRLTGPGSFFPAPSVASLMMLSRAFVAAYIEALASFSAFNRALLILRPAFRSLATSSAMALALSTGSAVSL